MNENIKNLPGLVLIADDDKATRTVLRRYLSAEVCCVLEAADGEDAVRLARAHRPDVVLLDIAMPKKDGLEVLTELAPELRDTAFIIITGNEDEKVARECLESGAFDYITKPVDMCVLGHVIRAWLCRGK